MINATPRVRFAPSPTGYLHVGGLRTALYNYLFARNQGGQFILRIEDTDRTRYVEGAVENIISALKWAGLDYDEGPDIGGQFGPYYQSHRLEIYKKYALQLVSEGKAYYAFDTPERLKELREEQMRLKLQPVYDKAALSLSANEVQQKLNNNEPYVIRLNVPKGERIVVNDIIRGRVEFDSDIVDDQILMKSDGFPTYHLANVVDDHLMKITHVIRGEEWLSSAPKHVLLYDFLGWEIPEFAHLPLLLNADRSKLSKRQNDVAVEDYRAKGYLKEGLVNFVALLGWSAGDNKEIYNLSELVECFSLNRVNNSGAVFNLEKLNWLNTEHLRSKPDAEATEILRSELSSAGIDNSRFSDEFLLKVITSMKERVSFAFEYVSKCRYFYEEFEDYDVESVSKNWKPDSSDLLLKLYNSYAALENPTKEDYEHSLKNLATELGIGAGKLIHPLRIAVSGISAGPGVFDITDILGKEITLNRIKQAIDKLK